jgi:hypothetical protein
MSWIQQPDQNNPGAAAANHTRTYSRNGRRYITDDTGVEYELIRTPGSEASGDMLYYNGSNWVRVAIGTEGHTMQSLSGVPTWSAAPSVPIGRTIVLAKSGGDATTLVDAINQVNALIPAPSDADRALILAYSGDFTSAPVVVPEGVTLVSVGGHETTKLIASTATAEFITLSASSVLKGFKVTGANGVGGVGVKVGAVTADLNDVAFCDCTIGLHLSGSTVHATLLDFIRVSGETLITAMLVDSVAQCRIESLSIKAQEGFRITNGVECDDSGTYISVGLIDIIECTRGIYAHDSGVIDVSSGSVVNCATAVELASSAEITASLRIKGSDNWDVLIADDTPTFTFTGGKLRHENLSIHPNADTNLVYISKTPGDEAFKVAAELHVGSEKEPKESAFAGGDSHVRGMVVFTNTNLEAGSWNNITNTVNVDDASSVGVFAGIGVGQCLYIGGDYVFPGVKVKITTALVVGTGTLVFEFWNGSAWISFNSMSTDADPPHDQYAQSNLTRVNSEHIRFDIPSMSSWATKLLNGETKYWVRYRVVTAITSVPEVDIFKVHTNRFEINASGLVEWFGTAEPQRNLQFSQRLADDLTGASPGNVALELASGITIQPQDNNFSDNQVKGIGTAMPIPIGLDTSREIHTHVLWRPSTNNTGDVELEHNYAVLNEGDLVNGTAPVTNYAKTTPISNQLDELIHTNLIMRIPDALPEGLLVFSILRDATGGNAEDTFTGAVEIIQFTIEGTFWK